MRHDRSHDWIGFGWLFPLLMIVLVAVAAVLITRLVATRAGTAATGPLPPPPLATNDQALAQVRMRYASGQINRDEYVRLQRDLGGFVPDDATVRTAPPPSPPIGPTAAPDAPQEDAGS